MKIQWLAGRQHHPEVGELESGQKYDVREDLGKAWCKQGVAEPEPAEAHKAVKTARKNGEKE